MDFVLILPYCVIYALLIKKMMRNGTLEWCHLGIISILSVGYYVLPELLKQLSPLGSFSSSDIAMALLLHGLFLLMIVFGMLHARRVIMPTCEGLSMPFLDRRFVRYRRSLFVLAYILYASFTFSYAQTSYSAQDATAFFTDPEASLAILSSFAGLLLAVQAVSFAIELKNGQKRIAAAMIIAILFTVVIALSSAQRLAIITPLATVVIALFATRQRTRALRSMLMLVAVLLTVSPFTVFLREKRVDLRGRDKILTIAPEFSYGDSAFVSTIRSIMDRSDLLSNSVRLKEYIDEYGYVGWEYYYSVLINPIPKAIIGSKPYLLSSDGTIWGHISVIAWAFDGNGIGSRTAFGAITAYRQGGWIAVGLDGFAAGVLFVLLARWLGNGGPVAIAFYCALFPLLAVKRVPPSFFEALSEVLPMLPFITVLAVLNATLSAQRAIRRPRLRLQGIRCNGPLSLGHKAMHGSRFP